MSFQLASVEENAILHLWVSTFFIYQLPPCPILARGGYCHFLRYPSYLSCLFIQILPRPVFRNYLWQLYHIFRADQPYMEPVHCQLILTIWHSALKLWPSPWKFSQDQLHILWVYQPNMTCALQVHFHCLTFDYDIMTLTLKILSSALLGLEILLPTAPYFQYTLTWHGTCAV